MKPKTTMIEEKFIKELCGQENTFCIPEGYFEALPQQVMCRINQRRTRNTFWKWAAAAVVAGMISTAGILSLSSPADTLTAAEKEYTGDELDYSLIDNMDIAYYLSEAK